MIQCLAFLHDGWLRTRCLYASDVRTFRITDQLSLDLAVLDEISKQDTSAADANATLLNAWVSQL